MERVLRFLHLKKDPQYKLFRDVPQDPAVQERFTQQYGLVRDPDLRTVLADLDSKLPGDKDRFLVTEIQDILYREHGIDRSRTLQVSASLRWQNYLSTEPDRGSPNSVFYNRPKTLAFAAILWERSQYSKQHPKAPDESIKLKDLAISAKEKLAGSRLAHLIQTTAQDTRRQADPILPRYGARNLSQPAAVEPTPTAKVARAYTPQGVVNEQKTSEFSLSQGFLESELAILKQLRAGNVPITKSSKGDIPELNDKLRKIGFYITAVGNEFVLRKS